MRRRTVHLGFGLACAALAGVIAFQAWSLHQAGQVAAAIAGAPGADPALPQAQWAQALRHADEGEFERALLLLKALARSTEPTLRNAALYNLGNLHLREALRRRAESAEEALPYLELAKQHYRDVLRADPQDWDARYNLERALWLAPEEEQVAMDAAPPVPSERAITTMRGGKAALP